VELTNAENQLIEMDRVSLFIAPPVTFNVKKVVDKDGKPSQAIEVTNQTNENITCTARLELTPLNNPNATPIGADSTFEAIEPTKAKGTEVPLPGVDLSTGPWRATSKTTIGRITVIDHQTLTQD